MPNTLPLDTSNAKTQETSYFLEVAVNRPLFQTFTYKLEASTAPTPGCRVLVKIGPSKEVGIITEIHHSQPQRKFKIKDIELIIDTKPTLSQNVLKLLIWASKYYAQPIGETLFAFIPTHLKQNKPLQTLYDTNYKITQPQPNTQLAQNAHKQLSALDLFQTNTSLTQEELRTSNISSQTIKQLLDKKLIHKELTPPKAIIKKSQDTPYLPELNSEQTRAITAITNTEKFETFLLEGVTGSGKTEVYTKICEHYISRGKQVLLLVPEIGLTPQLEERLTKRLNAPIITLHSNIANKERARRWLQTSTNTPIVVIGTRSALACDLPNLGCIILDEEHDASFKQQEGIRYHSKSLSMIRGKNQNIPVILGSATPSLETIHNAQTLKFKHLKLTKRATGAQLPDIQFIDTNALPSNELFAPETIHELKNTIKAGQQALVFINRRGYSPTIQCTQCGWVADCQNCDVALTVHKSTNSLDCHHCETKWPIPNKCPHCFSPYLQAMGFGSERIEIELNKLFPDTTVLRMDRDSTQTKGSMENIRDVLTSDQPCILVGTQMVAKGHDFPNLTFTAILNSDNGLYSHDFRGKEVLVQTLIQVAGRSGRAEKQGKVIIQTNYPEHPTFQFVAKQDYINFCESELASRKALMLPPFSHQAVIRLNSFGTTEGLTRLTKLQQSLTHYTAENNLDQKIHVSSAMPASIERKSNWYRYLIVLSSPCRKTLHQTLHFAQVELSNIKRSKKLKWVVDVDPIDTI